MITVKKVIAIDENRLYPHCHICGKELSPYQVESELAETTLKFLELCDLILGKLNNKLVILICNKCVKLREIDNEKIT